MSKKIPTLSTLKRKNAAARRAFKYQEQIMLATMENRYLLEKLSDITGFNDGSIDGRPADFSPKLTKTIEVLAEREREKDRLGTRY